MPAALSDPIHYAPVTRPYRRWLALSIAVLLHLALLGSVAGLPFGASSPPATSLDVVLVTRASSAPVEAAAIAEQNQRAAGQPDTSDPAEARALTQTRQPRREAALPPTQPTASRQRAREALATLDASDPAVFPTTSERAAEAHQDAPGAVSPSPTAASADSAVGRDSMAEAASSRREQGRSLEVAGFSGESSRQAAQQAAEARYIDDWTRRIEAYGNRVHPAPPELHGQLRIRVVIGRDGELRQTEVVQSSGHAELDRAALETVHGAGPYRPFDGDMGALDSLSITRVWRFGQGNHYGVRQGP
ncbi:energy transducer TonB [Billgrantia gudaonensis]|uniref:Protein TonB n=1 Tax=Billgrantia gudaonensis TaxID=376427 RepID=A0A1G8PLV6_9GAMM|nr:TonB family protein [Halomonas gudaonensis]SDI93473.1 protein TonB [Halomonas gudaonensis]